MFIIGTPFAKGAGYGIHNQDLTGNAKQEYDIKTCPHCQAVLRMQLWRQVQNNVLNGGFCGRCNAPICASCNKRMQTHGCEPFIQKLERSIEDQYRLQQFRKLAGLEQPEPVREHFTTGA